MSEAGVTDILIEVDTDTLPLDRIGACFVVARGEVRLFAGAADNALARRPVGRIGAGGLLFGLGTSFLGDETLIAVKSRDTAIYVLPDDWTAAEPTEAFTAGLEQWLTTVVSGLASVIEPKPRIDVSLSSRASRVGVAAGAVLASHEGVTWVNVGPGAHLLGLEAITGWVPLPPGAWLTADEAGTVAVLDMRSALAMPAWADGLANFHNAVVETLPLVRGLGEADEFNRLKSRATAQRHAHHETADRFAQVLGNPSLAGTANSGEPVLDVMRMLAQALDIRLVAPVRARQAQMDRPATPMEIARASNIRLQPVKLKNMWWRSDAGPLLAQRADGEYVALMRHDGHYQETDSRGRTRRVDAQVAAALQAQAHSLFTPRRAGPVQFAGLLLDSLRGSRGDVLAYLATMLVSAVLAQVLPLATGFVLGVLAPAGMQSALVQIGVLIVLMGLVGYVTQLAAEVARLRIQARSNGLLYSALWDRIASLPLNYFRRQTSAEVVARAGSAMSVPTGVQIFLFTAAASLGMIVSSLVTIAIQNPLVALLALALALVQIGSGAIAGYFQARAFLNGEQLEGLADALFVQIVNGLVKLRTAGAEERAVTRWADRFAAMRARQVNSRRVQNIYEAWLATFSLLAIAVLFVLVSMLATTESGLPVAQVVATLTAFSILVTAVGQLTSGCVSVWMLAPSWKYGKPLLEVAPESNAGRSDPGTLTGEVEFASVSFRYGEDSAPVFNNLSFRARAGEMVAIVGRSGAGKSTLVRLALGLESPASGAIYVDSQDLRSLQPSAYRAQVGVVLQEGKLPPGTLFDIVRGTSAATTEQVWQALQDAAIAAEVAAMPMGLHTLLHDATRTLSGGQVQRIALARAFLQAPALLILDEATSALDNATQAIAMHRVLRMRATRLVIAHRISTIRHADRILVLEGGRIVEQGSYDELMARNGVFTKLAHA